jgi:hypothetical protein
LTRITFVTLVDQPGQFDQGKKYFDAKEWAITPVRHEQLGPGFVVRRPAPNADARSIFVPIATIKSVDYAEE